MQIRKDRLENDYYYHVYSRTIAQFKIFNNPDDYSRMLEMLKYYSYSNLEHKYSKFINLDVSHRIAIIKNAQENNDRLVEIIAFCIMPTHIHLILKQVSDNGISIFMSKLLNSYSRYFNFKHKRQGPLWSGRFKSVLVDDDNQLLHLTRYIHLNPSSAELIDKPEKWQFSSYLDYLDEENGSLINNELISVSPRVYKKFVNDRKAYQRELSLIKNLLIDNYSG